MPILLELRRRGHGIATRTLASEVETVRRLGIASEPVSQDVERVELDDYRAQSAVGKGMRALATFAARAGHEVADLARAIGEHDPDVIVVDVNCWGAATVAEASGRPWAMYSPYLLMAPSRDAPPFGLGWRPLDGPLGRVRDALAHRVGSRVVDRAVLPRLSSLRARHELPSLRHFDDLFERPHALLAMTAEGFEYPRSDWPANVRLVGAVNWSPPTPAPAWLDELSDPLVLVTCSTERQHDERLLHAALQALPPAGMSVLGTAAAHDPSRFDAPTGSRVVRFLAHEPVLERAACVVCHGGMGITQKALAAEVPVVVVPFGRDQLETARRVELARAGVRLPLRRLTPARLLDAVEAARECRAGARRVSRAYAAAGGHVAAADAIEALGAGRRAP